MPQEQQVSRRQVLRCVAGTGLALLLPVFADAADQKTAWTSAGAPKTFPLGQPTRVALTNGPVVYVTRTGPKAFTAISSVCTHRGCEVAWVAANKDYECPCHGSVFAPNGTNVHGTRRNPGEKLPPLTAYPTRVVKGDVQVGLPVAPAPPSNAPAAPPPPAG